MHPFLCEDLLVQQTDIIPREQQQSLAMAYHENSKLDEQASIHLGVRISQYSANPYYTQRAPYALKAYPSVVSRDLSVYGEVDSQRPLSALKEKLLQRKSARRFNKDGKISEYALFSVLQYSYGVVCKEGEQGFRPIPSAGALYPLEVYVLLLKGDIEKGLYHFRADTCSLSCIRTDVDEALVQRATGIYPVIAAEEVGAFIFTTAVFARVMVKYGDRAYRFILQESGALANTMQLLCGEVGLGACQLGGFVDGTINDYIGIDGYHESVVNVQAMGVL